MNRVACLRLRASAATPPFPSRCRAAPQAPRSVSRLPPRASASTTAGIYLSSFLSLPSPHEQIQPFSSPFHLLNIRQFVTEAKIKVGRSPYLALPGPPPLSQGCFMSTTGTAGLFLLFALFTIETIEISILLMDEYDPEVSKSYYFTNMHSLVFHDHIDFLPYELWYLLRTPYKISVDLQLDYERDPPIDDAKSLEKESTLNVAVSQLASDFDRESNLCLERFSRTRRASVIPTGSLKLDLALGIGGLPKGRMVEIFGKESSGKTTLALHVIKEAQKSGGYCAYIDAENAFDPSFAEAIGVDTEKLLIAQPDSAENSLSIVNTLVGGSIDVVVVDSVAALIPKCELEGEIHTNYGETQSRLMTRALRKIQYTLSRSETLIIFVNQVRTRRSSKEISGLYKEVACGGNALGFYAAIRVRTSRKELRYTDDQATGIGISVQIIKNKLAPAVLKEAGIDITFGKGIAYESEILEMASSHGVIVKEGCGYWINGEFLTDKAAAEKFLLENVTVADDICGTMRSQLFER